LSRKFPLLTWFSIILSIIVLGTLGFMIVEHFKFLDALYMTVITITTIGYNEVRPLNTDGKIFNLFLILVSFSTFTYALARLTQYVASGEMALFFKNRKTYAGY
jgi:voltage-gated potassium channel